ncbi:hypothetical protein DKX38_007645 [Salix brachista]|uniref:Uncharacterized protein n=1 Tax=Salix brachista TaxID=2182728 RepID=A0A5N5MRB9_9ROSI|nr:hypothetical protein DKX38_007645 [Salix brachista]
MKNSGLMNNSLNSGIVTIKAKVPRKIYWILMVHNFCKIPMFMLGLIWGIIEILNFVYYLICQVSLLADETEVVKSLPRSRLSRTSGVDEKIELLQRAEENYYQNKNFDKLSISKIYALFAFWTMEPTNLKRHSTFQSPLLEQKPPETSTPRLLHHTFESETSTSTSPSQSFPLC